jgi:O-glycosyl hydrolase
MDWSRPDIWGRLKRAHYNDYADLLADYVKNFEAEMGAPLDILSVQNEPNWKVEYESAYWNGIDLRDFIKVIAQRFPIKDVAVGKDGIGIMMPEFENFNINFNEMIKPSLDDPESERIISHIALHQYNGAFDASSRAGSREFPEIIASGKPFWQTEVSGSGTHIPKGNGILNALYYARMIHWNMTLAQTNAFLFWWLWSNNPGTFENGGCLIFVDGGEDIVPAHRLYAMGQFSRFIRPGWQRITSTTARSTGAYSSAYKNPLTNEIAVVIINERITSSNVSLDLIGADFDRLEIWRTSEKEQLKSIGQQRTSGSSAIVHLAPLSITTFYGRVK